MVATTENKIEVLSRARDIISREGGKNWSCGSWGKSINGKTTNVCAMSAIYMAMPRDEEFTPNGAALAYEEGILEEYEAALMKYGRINTDVPTFNDRNGYESVVKLFDRTIEALIMERDTKREVPTFTREQEDEIKA